MKSLLDLKLKKIFFHPSLFIKNLLKNINGVLQKIATLKTTLIFAPSLKNMICQYPKCLKQSMIF